MPPVTAIVITRNEAAHIRAALESVAFADEIIVVDSESTDDTARIASECGARVVVRAWPGYVAQKNFAASLASHNWIFSLDADERVTPALADQIRQAIDSASDQAAGFRVPRVTFHLGRWIRSTDWYPDHQLRLYHRARARWAGHLVHESVQADGVVHTLSGELLHYAYRDIAHHWQTMNHYTSLAAHQMFERHRRARWWHLLLHPPAAFLRNYLLRGGFRDGVPGLIISAMNARYVGLKYAKLWELWSASTSTPPAPGAADSNRPS